MKVRTRFAPSPTGSLHIGGVRTALFSWLYAKQNDGDFVLRIEDTDRERSSDESVQVILDGMDWLNLQATGEPVFQSHRFDRYNEVIDQLIDQGDAYFCDCSRERLDKVREQQQAQKQKPKYDGRCRQRTDIDLSKPYVIRFNNPSSGSVVFNDMIKGKIEIANKELDDLIIRRSDGAPTYNLTVVVDDWDMNISHVVRGDDHINNTPRQINILKALDADIPFYAHVPMILGEGGKRLSKRHGATGVLQYELDGFLPEALLNYLVRLGWSYKDQELFSIDEMIELFSLEEVNKAPSTFNPEKLLWVNHQHIMQSKPKDLVSALKWQFNNLGINTDIGPDYELVIAILQERAKTMLEMAQMSKYFYEDFSEFEQKAAKKNLKQSSLSPLKLLLAEYENLEEWTQSNIHGIITKVAADLDIKMGKVGQPLRVAVTGGGLSPSIDITLELIGKSRSISRIKQAIIFINNKCDE